jgi:DNA-binding LytR/AlgR family response regulator
MEKKCLLVDDEIMALDLLENYISRVQGFSVVNKFSNPLKARDYLKTNKVDILFLDIEMPQINGLDFAEKLGFKPLIIFTTAHSNFGAHAFDLNATDYLVKPYSFDRFLKTISKINSTFLLSVENQENSIQIKQKNNWINVNHNDIIYIEGWKEYVRFHCSTEVYTHLISMSELEETLPNTFFLRVHKSFIINLNFVKSFNKETIVMINDVKIPVSRLKKDLVYNRLIQL